jgi:hypothetical protein
MFNRRPRDSRSRLSTLLPLPLPVPLPLPLPLLLMLVLVLVLVLVQLRPPLIGIGMAPADRTDVYVLGTLYKRHQAVPAYDLATLRRIVTAIKPDVLVLDCTPREVEEQKVFPSKIEYPGVIFPFIRDGKYHVYAAEPKEPLFTEIVSAVAAAHEAFKKNKAEASAAFEQFQTATYASLIQYWQSAAEVNDDVTGAVLSAKKRLEAQLIGATENTGWMRWNRHWSDKIIEAAAQHPGTRILAVTGIENRPWIVADLQKHPSLNVIDMPAWLRAHAADTQP